jgi:acyl carrier protein
MSSADTLQRVAEIVRRTFRHSEATVTTATTADEVNGWDSLTHSVFLMNIERAFGIRFVPTEVLDLENIGELVRTIDARLAAGRNG